jgi:hypothetical protein
MFSFEEYIIGWSVYLVAVMGILAVFWRMTRSIPWLHVKQCLRLIVATLFLVPTFVEPQAIQSSFHYLSPAWIQGILQLIFSSIEKAIPIGRLLLMSLLGVFIIYLLILIAQYFVRKKVPTAKAKVPTAKRKVPTAQ